jgi:capsid protein
VIRLGPFQFGYAAVEDKDRRKAPSRRVWHEQAELPDRKRQRLQATAQEQARNHSLVAWMVRKHLDYVSKFHVSFRTENEPLDNLVNRIFKWHGAPRNLDFMGRFGRDEFFRLYEMEKVLCGDAGIIKLPDLKLQSLESDLIAKGALPQPATAAIKSQWDTVNDAGLVVDALGRPTGFAVCNRGPDGKVRVFDHVEPIENVIFDAYWTRFGSQWRGVSPLSTAINTVADVHEALEYNIIKAKMHALFGVAILRKSGEDGGGFGYGAGEQVPPAETPDPNPYAPDTANKTLNPRTINMLDLDPDEDVKVIESGTPSSEFVEGTHLFVHIAMLALDIPVTCFDSRRSSFSARIADLNEYEVSCDAKRTKNRYVRQAYSDWVLEQIWNDPASPWPLVRVAEAAGFRQLRELQEEVEWIPSGAPWLDKLKQIQGDELAISLCLDNSIDAARRKGGDVFHNIDQQAKVIEYAKAKGVPIVTNRASDKTAADQADPDETERRNDE